MAGEYEFYLTNDAGVRIDYIGEILSATMTITDGKIGAATFTLPQTFDTNLIKPDYIIQPWRKPDGGSMSLLRPYFIRKWRFETRGADETIVVTGYDSNELLRRRIVAAYSRSSAATKTLDFADDMMKEFVTQQFADGVAPAVDEGTRVLSGFSVQGDASAGPLISVSGAWKKLLSKSGGGIIGAIKKASREKGTEVFFDVKTTNVTESTIAFQFQTKIGQPGQDVSDRVVFSQEDGNLRDPFLEFDYTNEENYIYALGPGQQSNRNVQQVADSARYNVSKWARIEGTAEARGQSDDDDEIQASGESKLEQGRPIRRFGGIPVDTGKTRFGVNWNWGDRVTAKYRGQEFDAIIRTVTVSVDENGRETIRARLDFEG
jgi:hypothetical protein